MNPPAHTPETKPATSPFVDGLNPRQREAVEYRGRSLLIVAGAGSGKTRVLTHRIAHLLYTKQAWPSQILAITFTNKAAAEMRSRVQALLGGEASGMWISTFHSAAVRILRTEAKYFGFTSAFTIYDSQDTRALLKRILKQFRADVYGMTPAWAAGRISKLKNELTDSESFQQSSSHGDPKEALLAEIYTEYSKQLRRANAFDFDDLISQTVFLFRAYPEIADRYRTRFRFVLVDEYQDTNHAQYELIRELSAPISGGERGSLTVVGDSDQSIYAFRGADIRNITDFEHDFAGAHTVLLEQNYRSTQNILSAANAVISNNFDRRDKSLWTDIGAGAKITGFAGYSAHDEGQYVADEIERLHDDEGVQYRGIAVFYRTNAQTRALEDMFIRAGLPYRLIGGTRFYERAEIKDAMAYLTVIANPNDELAARRILNVPKRGIGQVTETALATWAATEDVPLTEALLHADELGFGPKIAASVTALGTLLSGLQARSTDMPVDNVLTEVLDATGYLAGLHASVDPQDEARAENLEELVSLTAEYQKNNPDGTLVEFLTEVSLVAAADELDDESGTVSMMTLHTAKGLEFDTVFITGVEEELLPHRMAMQDIGGPGEERRLFYVGMTRAKRRLYLTLASSRSSYTGPSVAVPSRFLDEIPSDLIEWVQAPPKPVSFGSIRGNADWNTLAPAKPKHEWANAVSNVRNNEGLELDAGDRVHHATFGDGVVMAVTGSGAKAVAEVRFDSVGKKKLLIKIAPIEKIDAA